jgi:hypothetical protein
MGLMPKQRDDETHEVIDAVLKHLQQVKEDTVKMIEVVQNERDRKKPQSNRARKGR